MPAENEIPLGGEPSLVARLAEVQKEPRETRLRYLGRLANVAGEYPQAVVELEDLPAIQEPINDWHIRIVNLENRPHIRAYRELTSVAPTDVENGKKYLILMYEKAALHGVDLKMIYQFEGLIEAEVEPLLTPGQTDVINRLAQPYTEIAEALGVNVATVTRRLNLAAKANNMSLSKFIKTVYKAGLIDLNDAEFSVPLLNRAEKMVLEQILLPINKHEATPLLSNLQIRTITYRIYEKMGVYSPMQAFIVGLATNNLDGI